MMFNAYDDLLNVQEACHMLRISRNSLYGLLKSGELKAYQQGRVWKIPKRAILEYITDRSGVKIPVKE